MKKKHLRVLWTSAIALLAIVFVFFSACGLFSSSDDDDDDEKKDSGSTSATVEEGEVENVTLSESAVTICTDEEINLIATVAMTYGEFKGNYYWSSSKTSVAYFSSTMYGPVVGLTGNKVGTTTVTISAGGKSASCEITVIPKPVVVESEEEFETALQGGGYIELASDMEGTFEVTEETVIDLSGKTLTAGTDEDGQSAAENTVTVAEGATLTITDSGESGTISNSYTTSEGKSGTSLDNAAAVYVEEGTLVMEGGSIESSSIGIKAEDGANVTINGGEIESGYFALWLGGDETTVTINDGTISGEDKGIVLCGDGDYGHSNGQTGAVQTLTINGGTFYCEKDSVVCTLGNTNKNSSVINISGGTFTNKEITSEGAGVPMPTVYVANGTLTVTGGEFNGSTPMEIRGGTAKISGGKFNCEKTFDSSATYNSSGATSYGYALSVFPYTSGVKVSGGSDTADNAVEVSVTGGTFSGKIFAASEDSYTAASKTCPEYTLVISGGTFTVDPSDVLTEAFVATESDGVWVVSKKSET